MGVFYYNHLKGSNKPDAKRLYEVELLLHNDEKLRRYCIDFRPDTHAMCGGHILRHCLPGAYNLDVEAIRDLNRILPGVIYDMPKIVEYLKSLSMTAIRDTDTAKAQNARDRLKKIACPVTETRDSTPITPHILYLVQAVAEDFYLVKEVYNREVREGATNEAISAIRNQIFSDIPDDFVERICRGPEKIHELIKERVGQITGWKGRGVYDQWKDLNGRVGRRDYIDTIRQDAKQRAEEAPPIEYKNPFR